MIRGAFVAVIAALFTWTFSIAQSNPVATQTRPQQQPKLDPQGKPAPKSAGAFLTGCMDEQDGQWVLVSDHTMAVIANLAADGFPTEAFAKHMGHKVTVRGTSSSGGSRPLFKVRTIEMVSESCTAR
jgi:hypothetical protein